MPPFYFSVTPDFSGVDLTQGTRGHDILALVYTQKSGEVRKEIGFFLLQDSLLQIDMATKDKLGAMKVLGMVTGLMTMQLLLRSMILS